MFSLFNCASPSLLHRSACCCCWCYHYCHLRCAQRKLIDGVWRLAVSNPSVAAYRDHRRKQRFITFQLYMTHGALYLRDSPGSGVSVVDGVPSITLEIPESAALTAVAEVRLLLLCCSH
jgi:hypothetical protein